MGSQKQKKLEGKGEEREIGNHNFLPLTSQTATVESRNVTPPTNPKEAPRRKKKVPEAQNYLIQIHILLAPGLLLNILAWEREY